MHTFFEKFEEFLERIYTYKVAILRAALWLACLVFLLWGLIPLHSPVPTPSNISDKKLVIKYSRHLGDAEVVLGTLPLYDSFLEDKDADFLHLYLSGENPFEDVYYNVLIHQEYVINGTVNIKDGRPILNENMPTFIVSSFDPITYIPRIFYKTYGAIIPFFMVNLCIMLFLLYDLFVLILRSFFYSIDRGIIKLIDIEIEKAYISDALSEKVETTKDMNNELVSQPVAEPEIKEKPLTKAEAVDEEKKPVAKTEAANEEKKPSAAKPQKTANSGKNKKGTPKKRKQTKKTKK